MKILLDQGMPKMLRRILRSHFVVHAYDLGWHKTPDGDLLRLAETHGFEALITTDKKMFYQQNNAKRRISLVVLSDNRKSWIAGAHDRVLEAVESSTAGSFITVEL